MNTNSNVYTIIYTSVLVIVVAAILAFAATFLKPAQEANVKVETMSKILAAAGVAQDNLSNDEIIALFYNEVAATLTVSAKGYDAEEVVDKDGKPQIFPVSYLKVQSSLIAKGQQDEGKFPVYCFNNGLKVVPIYGAGLWGPIWGYIAFAEDNATVSGAIFDHKGETPGLGAKIAEKPFYSQFAGKSILDEAGEFVSISVVKGGANGSKNGVDAVSGGTITSKAVDTSLRAWLGAYRNYFLACTPMPLNENVEEPSNE
ncbi:MAG: NADH:ubiquinone reductase (Na(+)-transporting) subunit C [Bacteroidales bacterium]|nr:NADH:ubiquinone reductase (Na(+)-transporting) subunit C [Bacteroidales bacterium]